MNSFTKEKSFPLTDLQSSYFIGRQQEVELGGNPTHAYSELMCVNYNHERFERAVEKLILSHEMLRCRFADGMQQIMDDCKITVPYNDISNMGEDEKAYYLEAKRNEIFRKEYDLVHPPLVYFETTRISQKEAIIHFSHDGIIVDGWSHEIIIKDLDFFYCEENAHPYQFQYQFENYCQYLSSLKGSEDYERDKAYWREKIKDMPGPPEIPQKKNAGKEKAVETEQIVRVFSKDKYHKICSQSVKMRISTFAVMITAYAKAISRYSNRQEFILNVPVSNRPPLHADIKKLVGEFSDFILFHYTDKENETFLETAKRVQYQLFEAIEHGSISGVEVTGEYRKVHGGSLVAPVVFTSTLDIPFEREKELVKRYSKTHTSQVWIDTIIMHCQDNILYTMDCVEGMFDEIILQSIADCFISTLEMLAEYGLDTENSTPLSPKESNLINSINDTQKDELLADSYRGINYYLLNSIEKNLNETAVEYCCGTLTYGELKGLSQAVLCHLNSRKNISGNRRIGLMLTKSYWQVVCELACVLGSYVFMPIETDMPVESIKYCLENAGISLLVTDMYKPERYEGLEEIVDWVRIDQIDLSDQKAGNMALKLSADEEFCIINTSGTTGYPKSVVLKEAGLLNCLIHTINQYSVDSRDKTLAITNYCHDMSLFDIFGMLISGGTIVIPDDKKVREPEHWLELMKKYHVTIWNSVPAFIEMLLEDKKIMKDAANSALRLIFLGGDWVRAKTIKELNAIFASARKISVGGPSETTLWNISHEVTEEDIEEKIIPYGKPFPNTRYYILNACMEICPPGIEGEMFIEGIGVAKEYAGLPEETNKSFVTMNGRRLYKSGDRGYYSDRGIIFTGRADYQCKVNGKRIELMGIEHILNAYDAVNTCVAVLNKSKRIIAYYTSNREISRQEFMEYLEKYIPYYMYPSGFIRLDELPITGNGKIDRSELGKKELPEDNKQNTGTENSIVNELTNICTQILGTSVTLTESFFALGGNSISAIRLISRIRNTFGVSLKVFEILNNPFIKDWADIIAERLPQEKPDIDVQDLYRYKTEGYRLTLTQQEIWTYEMMHHDSRYTLSAYMDFDYILDHRALEHALQKVVSEEEVMGLQFYQGEDGLPYQKVNKDSAQAILQILRVSGHDKAVEYRKMFTDDYFDISGEQLFRVCLIEIGKNHCSLVLTMHHIIADEQAFLILFNRILEAYNGGDDVAKSTSYFLYIKKKFEQKKEQCIVAAEDIRRYKELSLPGPKSKEKFAAAEFRFDQSDIDRMMKVCNNCETSLFNGMLTAFILTLYMLTDERNIYVSVPASDRSLGDYENTVGLFISKIFIKNSINRDFSFREMLGEVKESVLNAFDQISEAYIENVRKEKLHVLLDQIHKGITFNMIDSQNQTPYGSLRYVTEKQAVNANNLHVFINKVDQEYICNMYSGNYYASTESLNRLRDAYIASIKCFINEGNKKITQLMNQQPQFPDISVEMERWQGEIADIREENIAQQFIESVNAYPDAIAVTGRFGTLSYKELHEQVLFFAEFLKDKDVQPGQRVALFCQHTPITFAAIYGILYIGATYVPVDCNCPVQRAEYILSDSEAEFLLTTVPLSYKVSIPVYTVTKEEMCLVKKIPPLYEKADQLAYIIYTSGTTGRPKGVPIHQKHLSNVCKWYGDTFKIDYGSRKILLSNFGFDGSIKTIFTPILRGGTVITAVDNLYEVDTIVGIIRDFKVTHLACVPSMLTEILKESKKNGYEELESVRYMLSGGEKFQTKEILAWRENPDFHCEIVNMYGPAECSAISTWHIVSRDELVSGEIPIGKPVYNRRIYILNEKNELCKPMENGHIWLSGYGIFSGYTKCSKEESGLLEDPFCPGCYMYDSGDIGRWSENGDLIFVGRADNQIKISGQRIEMEEVEQVLLSDTRIRNCAMKIQKAEDKLRTAIFYTTYTESPIPADELKDHMKNYLVEGVIPQQFIQVKELPLNSSGKVDRKQLVIPENLGNEEVSIQDVSELQEKIISAWKETLQVDYVPIDVGFFELGGYSLLFYRLQRELKNKLGIAITIPDILAHPTVKSLEDYLIQKYAGENKLEKTEFINERERQKRLQRKVRNDKRQRR
ncbi:AMP-binding protein [Anaerocolumna xylanovorans]|uniref:Amino acid adenylation domain-containing protein n=1 Tax=Anaerocolumna xylanovorans DSM 12503 TaxID=1121345 RepID=A0A1M7YI46_9FIRM|nr:AMP-binding protein [Anaerocolumna xylanovorans]SHO52312.1 amino acid adenylation domain-containing protein [Anaerocolumna xylanovorans DSM 12503]